jgi:hypothetical protein
MTPLFEVHRYEYGYVYDVTTDGRRFLGAEAFCSTAVNRSAA